MFKKFEPDLPVSDKGFFDKFDLVILFEEVEQNEKNIDFNDGYTFVN